MDEFEKEYFRKLNKLSSEYKSQRKELARSRIKMFAAAVFRQLIDERQEFDLIIASGNSGLFMEVITKMVYDSLKIKLPQIIKLPIFRFQEINGKKVPDDNLSLLPELSGKLNELSLSPNILFIDDEIMTGLTVKTFLQLLQKEKTDFEQVKCTIIAENHFFEWHYLMPNASIRFFSFARLIQGLNGNISFFIPEDLYSKINSLFEEVESYTQAMAIVVGGGLKKKSDQGVPFFDTSLDKICSEKIENYLSLKQMLINELKVLVSEGLEEYKQKKLQFRF